MTATLDTAAVTRGMRVLDVCTGPGLLAAAAVARGAQAVGVDFSAQAVAIAGRNVPEAGFQTGDAQALSFDDDSFDAVVCGFGVIHVPEPAAAIAEIRRVLRPGCRAALSTWEAPGPGNGFGALFGAIKAHGNLDVDLPHGPDFFQFSSNEAMSAALGEAGLRDITVQGAPQTWDFDDATGFVTAFVEGSVRARGLLAAQTQSARSAIFTAVCAAIEQYRVADGRYHIPMNALVGSGAK